MVAQLIEAATGNHVWAERYDRSLEDVFAVQDEITELNQDVRLIACEEAMRKATGSSARCGRGPG